MRISNLISLIVVLVVLTACAHPIVISPNIDKISASKTSQTIPKNVAYYIADDVLAKQVTTPGGGGDKVSYLPYRDIEMAFYKMLSNVFPNVTKLKTPNDAEALNKNGVSYIITPSIITDSSSPSPFTWPPTKFSAELSCNITDAAGNPVLLTKVTGQGAAEFSEFKTDFSMSGKRATEDALLKMQKALLDAPELRQGGRALLTPANSAEKTNLGSAVTATPAQTSTYAVVAAPPIQPAEAKLPAVLVNPVAATAQPATMTSVPASKAATTSVAPSTALAAPTLPAAPVASRIAEQNSENTTIQTVEFQVGVSSVTVEKMAKEAGCQGGKGASLLTTQGPVEVYRMRCDSGKTYMAKCELRQCSAMR